MNKGTILWLALATASSGWCDDWRSIEQLLGEFSYVCKNQPENTYSRLKAIVKLKWAKSLETWYRGDWYCINRETATVTQDSVNTRLISYKDMINWIISENPNHDLGSIQAMTRLAEDFKYFSGVGISYQTQEHIVDTRVKLVKSNPHIFKAWTARWEVGNWKPKMEWPEISSPFNNSQYYKEEVEKFKKMLK
jgi:hypothetical protein